MIPIIKAFEIWKYLDSTKQGFCFDEIGVIWDRGKCQDIIYKDNERFLKEVRGDKKEGKR